MIEKENKLCRIIAICFLNLELINFFGLYDSRASMRRSEIWLEIAPRSERLFEPKNLQLSRSAFKREPSKSIVICGSQLKSTSPPNLSVLLTAWKCSFDFSLFPWIAKERVLLARSLLTTDAPTCLFKWHRFRFANLPLAKQPRRAIFFRLRSNNIDEC